MYTLSLRREFTAAHSLIGGDWGAENERHSHRYRVEVHLEGAMLNEHGYLVDIVDVAATLDALVARCRDRTLNELPEFRGINPSIEHFARILCEMFSDRFHAHTVSAITIRVWEDDTTWASYRQEM